ncbi:MAG: DUF2891 family protein [Candidatus Caenarcaniphilales bacterium]|nr:DUF2891 family protein [Candidatus Caenarcaniphilales bacterium]
MQKPATNHPAFNACIDWHSSVHATWGLLRYQRISGDKRYEKIIKKILSSDKLEAELENLVHNPRFEMPYGRAWFLRLVIDYEKLFNKPDAEGDAKATEILRHMGDYLAESLLDYYHSHRPNPYLQNYSNPSWVLLNLYHYAQHRNDTKWIEVIEAIVRKDFITYKKPCSDIIKLNSDGFIAICENWAYLVAETEVLGKSQKRYAEWLNDFYSIESAKPLWKTNDTYLKALNFSKAWAYKGIYVKTENPEFLDLAKKHMQAQFENEDWWSGDDYSVTHWVAQFGLYAYSLNYN